MGFRLVFWPASRLASRMGSCPGSWLPSKGISVSACDHQKLDQAQSVSPWASKEYHTAID